MVVADAGTVGGIFALIRIEVVWVFGATVDHERPPARIIGTRMPELCPTPGLVSSLMERPFYFGAALAITREQEYRKNCR